MGLDCFGNLIFDIDSISKFQNRGQKYCLDVCERV